MVEIGLMLSDRAGLRVVLAIKRIPMKAASRFHQNPLSVFFHNWSVEAFMYVTS